MLAKLLNSTSIKAPFAEGEGLTRAEAASFADRSVRTIDGYCALWPEMVEHRFGRVYVSRVALAMLKRKDTFALRLYGAGDRSHPRVLPYYHMTGVTPPAASDAGR